MGETALKVKTDRRVAYAGRLVVYTQLTYSWVMRKVPVVVREAPGFSSWADAHWSKEVYAAFIDYIAVSPTVGALVPGTGGVRKVRWHMSGRGKSGGARIIYYYHDDSIPIFLITAYAKSEAANLSEKQKASMRLLTMHLKAEARSNWRK
jgi:RelE toxin of RelE / RelB toxin-antitoxin system